MTYQDALDRAIAEFESSGEPQFVVCEHDTGAQASDILPDAEGYGFASTLRPEHKYKCLTRPYIVGIIDINGYRRDRAMRNRPT